MNLLKDVKLTRVMNAVAAGTTVQNSSEIDMSGFEGVMFILAVGTLTATQTTSLKAQQTATTGTGYADITGSGSGDMADDDDNQCVVLDIYKPVERFVRAVVTRGVANAVIDGVFALQYGPGKRPTVQDATTVALSELIVSGA
jgi:hypothetical protein